MKNFVIVFDETALLGAPFNNKMYVDGYQELHDRALKRDIKIIFSRGGQKAYLGDDKFTHCSTFDESKIIEVDDCIADVVLDKSKYFLPEDSLNCINDRRIKKICSDKILTFKNFQQFSPHTELADNSDQLKGFLKTNGSKIVVLKPVSGSAGEEVVIDNANKINVDLINYPILAQEFIDSSGGIHGIVEGKHDLRINIINGDIVFAFVRTPGPGSFLAGIATGGKLIPIEVKNVPKELIAIKNTIDQKFNFSDKRFYTIDVAYDGINYKLIELNSQPGILASSFIEEYSDFHESLLDLVEKIT